MMSFIGYAFCIVLLPTLVTCMIIIFVLPKLAPAAKEWISLLLMVLLTFANFLESLTTIAELVGKSLHSSKNSVARLQAKEITLEVRKAWAFLLGWYSTMVLLLTAISQQELFTMIDRYLSDLGVGLREPSAHYLSNPAHDNGRQAQLFTELVYEQLVKKGQDIAQHFIAPHNLALALAPHPRGRIPDGTHKQIQTIVDALDTTPNLKRVPRRNLQKWLSRLHRFFERQAAGS
jgi:hypothetical protein